MLTDPEAARNGGRGVHADRREPACAVARIAQEQDKWKKVIERIKCDDSKKNLSIHSLHRELLLPPAANVTER